MKKTITVGDKFKSTSGHIWEVIETKPGGVVELFDKERTRFQRRYHREVKSWERVEGPAQEDDGQEVARICRAAKEKNR